MNGSLSQRKSPCERQNHEAGFTLIEVMIALTIFAIGLLALAGMQITGIKGNATAQSVSAKVALGSGVIEQIMALSGDEDEDDIADGVNAFNNFLTTNMTDTAWQFSDPDIAGAGICTASVTVVVDPTIGGTTYDGLTRIVVITTSPTGNPVTQTVMKRRY